MKAAQRAGLAAIAQNYKKKKKVSRISKEIGYTKGRKYC
jgi:hypothetical protein